LNKNNEDFYKITDTYDGRAKQSCLAYQDWSEPEQKEDDRKNKETSTTKDCPKGTRCEPSKDEKPTGSGGDEFYGFFEIVSGVRYVDEISPTTDVNKKNKHDF
jgi:hypothetical protein